MFEQLVNSIMNSHNSHNNNNGSNTVNIKGYRYDADKVLVLNKLAETAKTLLEGAITQREPRIPSTKKRLPELTAFIRDTVLESNTSIPTLLVCLLYVEKFTNKFTKRVNGAHDSCYRVFLACLILASKYVNDVTYKNDFWGSLWPQFNLEDVNSMERELLVLLNFKLVFSPEEVNSFIRQYFGATNSTTLLTPQSWYASVSV